MINQVCFGKLFGSWILSVVNDENKEDKEYSRNSNSSHLGLAKVLKDVLLV